MKKIDRIKVPLNRLAMVCIAAAVCKAIFAAAPVVTLTFDDNPKGHYTIAAPVLEKYGFRGAFNIVTKTVGTRKDRMTWAQIRELRSRGHEIVSHTYSHPDLTKMLSKEGSEAVLRELTVSRDAIRRETGAAPRFLCHPFCRTNAEVENLIRSAGMIPMSTRRRNFGSETTVASFAAFLDSIIAAPSGRNARVDILFHGVSKDSGGWNPLESAEIFEGCIAELSKREKKGLISVVNYERFIAPGRNDKVPDTISEAKR